jgi:hypothetical protein
MVLITGAHKAFALYKAIEEGVNHMWTVSAFQQHPRTLFICDEDATLELRVKTVKYFKVIYYTMQIFKWFFLRVYFHRICGASTVSWWTRIQPKSSLHSLLPLRWFKFFELYK